MTDIRPARVHNGAYVIPGPIERGVCYRARTGRPVYRIVKVHETVGEWYAVVTSEKLTGGSAGDYVGHVVKTSIEAAA